MQSQAGFDQRLDTFTAAAQHCFVKLRGGVERGCLDDQICSALTFKRRNEVLQCIRAVVENHLIRQRAFRERNIGVRHNLCGVDNSNIKARFYRPEEKDAIEHPSRRRAKPIGDIAHAQIGQCTRQFHLNAAQRCQRLQSCTCAFRIPGCQGESQWVENQRVRRKANLIHRQRVEAPGYCQLTLCGFCHSRLVYRQHNQRRAELPCQGENLSRPRLTPFQVHRVDDGASRITLKPCTHHCQISRIQHQWRSYVARQQCRNMPHRCCLISTFGQRHTHIQHMRPGAHLLLSQRHQRRITLFEH